MAMTPLAPKTSVGVIDTQPVALSASVLVLLQSVAAVLTVTGRWTPSPAELSAWISVYTSFVIVISAVVRDKVWSQRSVRAVLADEQAKTASALAERDEARAQLSRPPAYVPPSPVVPLFPLGAHVAPRAPQPPPVR